MKQSKSILITGGAGFIGFHLAKFHRNLGDKVYILDNLGKNDGALDRELAELLCDPLVEILEIDLTEPVSTKYRSMRFDVVYHLAAINGTRLFYEKPLFVATTNLKVTLNLIDWLKEIEVGRLVYSSTSEVYADGEKLGMVPIPSDESVPVVFRQPTDRRFSYGTSKFMGECLCRHYGEEYAVPTTILRYHNIYGPRMGWKHVVPEFIHRALTAKKHFELFGGSETRAFCYIQDAVEATARIAACDALDTQIVHVGNPEEEIPIHELALRILQLAGKDLKLVERGGRSHSVRRRCPDISKLVQQTGWSPSVKLEIGLKATFSWYSEVLSFQCQNSIDTAHISIS